MQGGDMLLEKYSLNHDYNSLLFPEVSDGLSVFYAVNLFLMFQNGDDSLYLDGVMNSGIINIILGAIIPLILTQLTFVIFVNTWRYGKAVDYPSIFYDAFKSKVGYIIISILYISGFISFTSYYTDNTVFIIKTLVNKYIGDHKILHNKYIMGYGCQLIFTVPFLLLNNFGSFKYFAIIANFFVLLTIVTTIYFMIKSIQTEGFDPEHTVKLYTKDFWSSLYIFNEFNNLYYSNPPLCAITQYINRCTKKTVLNIVFISIITTFLLNLVCGFSIHFTFYGGIEEDNALYYYDQNDFGCTIGYISSLINVIISNAAAAFLASDQLFTMFSNKKPTPIERIIPGLVIITFSYALIIVDNTESDFLDYFNGYVIIIIGYLIPCLCYLKMNGYRNIQGVISIFLVITSFVVMGLTTYDDFFR